MNTYSVTCLAVPRDTDIKEKHYVYETVKATCLHDAIDHIHANYDRVSDLLVTRLQDNFYPCVKSVTGQIRKVVGPKGTLLECTNYLKEKYPTEWANCDAIPIPSEDLGLLY